jgi:hypothetical protein
MIYTRVYPESNNIVSLNNEYTSEIKQFTFKLAYTDQIKTYELNLGIASDNTYLLLSDKIREDFGLNDFDIVIAGQMQKERANALPKNRISMRTHLGNNYNKSFYVRPKLNNITVSLNLNNSSRTSLVIGTCLVCLRDNISILRHYNCQHRMCRTCNDTWSSTNIMANCNRCPECRSE